MYHYVYKVIERKTGEFYIGSRSTKVKPEFDSYLGSMKTWNPNRNNLDKIIIKKDFSDRKSALIFESEMIKVSIKDQLNRNYYVPNENFVTNGFVTVRDKNGKCFNVSKDDERIKKGDLIHCRKGIKNKRKYTRENGNKCAIPPDQKGEKNSQFGTRWINNGLMNKKIKKEDQIPEGWIGGALQPKLNGVRWITNGISNKRLHFSEIPPEGWKFGKNQK